MTTLDNPKSKQRPTRQYPIDFVVPLQLEECVHRIEHSKPVMLGKTLWFVADIKILRDLDRDRTLFAVRFSKSDISMFFHFEGTLSRWEGTSTRIIGEVQQNSQSVSTEPTIYEPSSNVVKTRAGFSISVLSAIGIIVILIVLPTDPLLIGGLFVLGTAFLVGILLTNNSDQHLPISVVQQTIEHILLEEKRALYENR